MHNSNTSWKQEIKESVYEGSDCQVADSMGRPALHKGCPLFIDPYRVWDGFRAPTLAAKINKCADAAGFQEQESGHVVHGGIQAHILNRKCEHMFFHFMESGKETDGVMPFCTGKAEQEWHISVKGTVVAGKIE